MITATHARQFVGQHVVVHTTSGNMHHGFLHSVTNDGVYIRPMGAGPGYASDSNENDTKMNLLGTATRSDVEAQEAFWPFLFFPFFALAALGPWGWWW